MAVFGRIVLVLSLLAAAMIVPFLAQYHYVHHCPEWLVTHVDDRGNPFYAIPTAIVSVILAACAVVAALVEPPRK